MTCTLLYNKLFMLRNFVSVDPFSLFIIIIIIIIIIIVIAFVIIII